jgi:hypothetical protein
LLWISRAFPYAETTKSEVTVTPDGLFPESLWKIFNQERLGTDAVDLTSGLEAGLAAGVMTAFSLKFGVGTALLRSNAGGESKFQLRFRNPSYPVQIGERIFGMRVVAYSRQGARAWYAEYEEPLLQFLAGARSRWP